MEGERLREADASHRMNMNEYTGVAAGGAAPASPMAVHASPVVMSLLPLGDVLAVALVAPAGEFSIVHSAN